MILIFNFIKRHPNIVVAALLLFAISSYSVYGYTQNNPKFCTTCHLMNDAYDTWDASAMHEIKCHSCHESDILTSLDHVRKVIFENPDKVTTPTVIDNEVCEECHANNDPQFIQIANTAGHNIQFLTHEEESACIDCHGAQLHTFAPLEDTCIQCHSRDHDTAGEIMDAHCIVCHDFTATEHELIPQRDDCLQCHESQQTMGVSFPNGAHNNTACNTCHNLHIEEQLTECATCHLDILGGGLHTVSAHDNCNDCHVPHSSESMKDRCLSCHIDKIEHFGTAECSLCHEFARTPLG